MRSGITRRWLRGSLLITVLLVLLVEVMFLYSATRSYYNGVQQTMYRRFSSITGQLKMYTGETSQKTAASRSVALRRMVEQFSDKDKYEFMLLDSYGGVIASSSGTDAEGIVTHTDFEQAQEAVDGQGIAIYRTQSGEMVMAACCLVPYAAEDVAAMRLVTSLTLVEEQLKRTVVVALIMGAAVLAFTIMSGLYFVRSIVVPLGQVERTAAGIARGELDVRLPVTGDERDEVDRLRGTINRMAEGLEETEKMKNEFISSVSHELRTPLTSIITLAQIALESGGADAEERRSWEEVRKSSSVLLGMINDMLDIARSDAGAMAVSMELMDLGDIVASAQGTIGPLAVGARVTLTTTVAPDVPLVSGDYEKMLRILENLGSNAVKFTPAGGTVAIAAVREEATGDVLVTVSDNGIGIASENQERIFERFFQVDSSATRIYSGSGLGLALVREYAVAQGYTVTVESVLGEGSAFTVRIPVAAVVELDEDE